MFTRCSNASIVNFERVTADCIDFEKTLYAYLKNKNSL